MWLYKTFPSPGILHPSPPDKEHGPGHFCYTMLWAPLVPFVDTEECRRVYLRIDSEISSIRAIEGLGFSLFKLGSPDVRYVRFLVVVPVAPRLCAALLPAS